MPLTTVNPGDLIRALDWNDLINLVNEMEVRIALLESGTTPGSGNAPRITQVLPGGPVTAGDTIRIFGTDFDFTKGGHSVFFGDTRATGFLGGSNDTLLILEVPDPVAGAIEAGTLMTLTVSNLVGNTSRAITVQAKPVVTVGGLSFTFQGSRPTTPASNATIFYDFELRSLASEDLTVTITPTIAVIPPLPGGVVDPGLSGRIAVIDADGTERSSRQVQLEENATKTISLRLTLPASVNSLRYSLSATAGAPGVETVAESLPDQQVGTAGEQPDSTISTFEWVAFPDGGASFSTATGGVSGVDGTITIPDANRTVVVELRAMFANIPEGTTNNYQIEATVESPPNGWSAAVNESMTNPLPVTSPGGANLVDFDVTSPSASTNAVLRLRLTRQGATTGNRRTVRYRLTR